MHFEQKIQALEREISKFKKACQSSWPQPSDYTKLIDAQYALRAVQDENTPQPAH